MNAAEAYILADELSQIRHRLKKLEQKQEVREETKRNIYLVTRVDEVDYDQYESFVCSAINVREALYMSPRGHEREFPVNRDTDLEVELIGAYFGTESKIIHASFNAG